MSSAAWPALSAKVAVKSPSPALVRLPRADRAARVGDQVIEAAERGRDVVHGLLELGRVGDVGHRGGDRDAAGLQPPGGGGQAGRVPGDETDGRALGGERLGYREADAPASPGDQRAAAAQAKLHGKAPSVGHQPRLEAMPDGPRGVARIVAAVEPFDEVERSHQADVLAWLASTSDVYRRVKPATPPDCWAERFAVRRPRPSLRYGRSCWPRTNPRRRLARLPPPRRHAPGAAR